VNGVQFDIFEYDDDASIIEKYAVTQAGTLPSFFRIESKTDSVLKDGSSVVIKDVRIFINKLKSSDFQDSAIIESILASYPALKKTEIGYIWIKKNYEFEGAKSKTPIDIENLKYLDRYVFTTSIRAEAAVIQFDKDVTTGHEKLKKKIAEENKILEGLAKHKSTQVDDFVLEEITSDIVLKLPGGELLIDVFDAMDASADIPFILLAYKKKKYFKVYRHLPPLDEWINFIPPTEGIYLKVNTSGTKISTLATTTKIMTSYSNAIWHAENRLEISFSTTGGVKEEEVRDKILWCLSERIDYQILVNRQTAIKGTFSIPSINFNRAVFTDLVRMNSIFKYFLFFNERQKTVMQKRLFYLYYLPDHKNNIPNALTLTIAPLTGTDESTSAIVRVSHASNIQQANSVRLIISKLMSIYSKEYDNIVDIYSNIIPNFNVLADIHVKKVKKREDKKTGPRAVALRKFKGDLFGSRYPDQCQKEKQPYVIKTMEEAEKVAKKLGDPHKVMFFEGAWYACDPREPDDKNFKHLYPGLKENTSKIDAAYRDKFKLMPCCYTQDQYEKAASHLRKYLLATKPGETGGGEDEGKEGGMGYIMGSNKKLPSGRYGEMPFNWEKLFLHLEVKKIIRGRQTIYPVLRHGVMHSPDSFIHCLERTFNNRYVSVNPDDKKNMVMTVRKKMIPLISLGRQELYDYSNDDVKRMLEDPTQYIDPLKFISIAEEYYKCNIFMYVISEKSPNGDIAIPNHSQAYLPSRIDDTKPCVLMTLYENTSNEMYPYQCEVGCLIVTTEKGKMKQINFTFNTQDQENISSSMAKMAIKLFYDANDVFVVSTSGYESFHPFMG